MNAPRTQKYAELQLNFTIRLRHNHIKGVKKWRRQGESGVRARQDCYADAWPLVCEQTCWCCAKVIMSRSIARTVTAVLISFSTLIESYRVRPSPPW